MPDLSQNERLVLPLFADGKKPSNREIADKYQWSVGKVAGICHRLRLKNLIGERRQRDIQFSKPRPVKKGPTCQFIAGEPKDRNFCGKPAALIPTQDGFEKRSSYCTRHHEICYDRKRTQFYAGRM